MGANFSKNGKDLTSHSITPEKSSIPPVWITQYLHELSARSKHKRIFTAQIIYGILDLQNYVKNHLGKNEEISCHLLTYSCLEQPSLYHLIQIDIEYKQILYWDPQSDPELKDDYYFIRSLWETDFRNFTFIFLDGNTQTTQHESGDWVLHIYTCLSQIDSPFNDQLNSIIQTYIHRVNEYLAERKITLRELTHEMINPLTLYQISLPVDIPSDIEDKKLDQKYRSLGQIFFWEKCENNQKIKIITRMQSNLQHYYYLFDANDEENLNRMITYIRNEENFHVFLILAEKIDYYAKVDIFGKINGKFPQFALFPYDHQAREDHMESFLLPLVYNITDYKEIISKLVFFFSELESKKIKYQETFIILLDPISHKFKKPYTVFCYDLLSNLEHAVSQQLLTQLTEYFSETIIQHALIFNKEILHNINAFFSFVFGSHGCLFLLIHDLYNRLRIKPQTCYLFQETHNVSVLDFDFFNIQTNQLHSNLMKKLLFDIFHFKESLYLKYITSALVYYACCKNVEFRHRAAPILLDMLICDDANNSMKIQNDLLISLYHLNIDSDLIWVTILRTIDNNNFSMPRSVIIKFILYVCQNQNISYPHLIMKMIPWYSVHQMLLLIKETVQEINSENASNLMNILLDNKEQESCHYLQQLLENENAIYYVYLVARATTKISDINSIKFFYLTFTNSISQIINNTSNILLKRNLICSKILLLARFKQPHDAIRLINLNFSSEGMSFFESLFADAITSHERISEILQAHQFISVAEAYNIYCLLLLSTQKNILAVDFLVSLFRRNLPLSSLLNRFSTINQNHLVKSLSIAFNRLSFNDSVLFIDRMCEIQDIGMYRLLARCFIPHLLEPISNMSHQDINLFISFFASWLRCHEDVNNENFVELWINLRLFDLKNKQCNKIIANLIGYSLSVLNENLSAGLIYQKIILDFFIFIQKNCSDITTAPFLKTYYHQLYRKLNQKYSVVRDSLLTSHLQALGTFFSPQHLSQNPSLLDRPSSSKFNENDTQYKPFH